MKLLRPLLLAVVLAGAFFYFTTYHRSQTHTTNWLGRPSKLEITEAAGGETPDQEEQNNITVYRKNIGSVVNITSKAVAFDFFYGLVPQEGQGSGFIIDKEGHVLTNYHVIADARQVEVTLHNRKKYRATIGFAIPINTAKAVLNDLVTLGRVRRPALGVRTIPITPELADQMGLPADYGLLVVQVVPGGAADRAGLRGGNERAYLGNTPIMTGGDLIVAIEGQDVQDQQDLSHVMNNHRAGDSVRVTIYRGKRKMDVNVTLGEAREQV